MRLYLRRLKRLFLSAFISYFIVAIPGFVLVFTVLPHYIGYTEPKPYTDSVLLAFIWALLMTVFTPLIARKRNKDRERTA